MMKMLIKLDYNRIQEKGEYAPSEIERVIDQGMTESGIYKDADGYYVNGDFESFGTIILWLSKEDWFMDNVLEWRWYDSNSVENVLDFYKPRSRADRI